MSFPGFEPSAVARALGHLPESKGDFAEGYFEAMDEVSFAPGDDRALRSRSERGLCLRLLAAGTAYCATRDAIGEEAFRSAYRQVARTLPTTPVIVRWEESEDEAPVPHRCLQDAPQLFRRRLRHRGFAFPHAVQFRQHRRRQLVAGSAVACEPQAESFYSVDMHLPGGRWGTLLPVLDEDVVARLADLAAECARYAESPPTTLGPTTILLGPHAAAVLLHEALSHTLEIDTLASSGDPRAAIGHLLATEHLTVFDDPETAPPTVRRSFDDEGMPVVRRALLRAGRVEQLICDRLWAERYEGLIPGCGRRADRSCLPGPRSSHLEVESGTASSAELVSQVAEGLYLPLVQHASLDPLRGVCRLDAPGGVVVRDGELRERVGRCRLQAGVADLLARVAAVGSDAQAAGAGWCAKSDQKLPVWATTPTLVLEGIQVRPW